MDLYYVGQIILFAAPYTPEGFLPCDGRTLTIRQYEVLFTLLGTTYGGDGRTTFNLPDLRGRLPIGSGQGITDPKSGSGAPLTAHALASTGGAELVSLDVSQIPPHTHTFSTLNTAATTNLPAGNMLANVPAGTAFYIADQAGGSTPTTQQLSTNAVMSTGNSAPHQNIMPVIPLNYMICVQGIFPSPA